MVMNSVDAQALKKAFLSGAKNLEMNKEFINELNVFPVPDGDTGTNMTMTILSAAREVAAIEDPTMEKLAKAMSSGSLRGARGNSGVILSQLFRGFSKEIQTVETINVTTLANAFGRATETAYKAVIKPKEGTILTVARGMADKAAELVFDTDDVIEFAEKVIACGDETLQKTPDLLPVLKEAGVVDSGGMGLMTVLKGVLAGLKGEDLGDLMPEGVKPVTDNAGADYNAVENTDIKFGYCTEFIINTKEEMDEKEQDKFRAYLESIGDSIVFVTLDDIVKVHVHTNEPGNAIQKALSYGFLTNMKIDNMRVEHQEKLIKDSEKLAREQKAAEEAKRASAAKERLPYAMIAVCAGDGMAEIFRGIGATDVISGGQTMNPSTDDILRACENANADVVYVFPNNSNIILAANQARDICESCRIVVVPTKTVPQGVEAIINFVPEMSPEENLGIMTDEIAGVKTCEITYAVRDTTIDGKPINHGDIMAIGDSGLVAVGREIEDTALMALRELIDEDSELVTIYYGEEADQEKAESLCELAKKEFSGCEFELHNGGQPVYYYVLSVE
ncbi:DAK2 domain-containing protein [[Clostridium] aminophilum]|uniref:DAK2 domain-containing protein n=1 Tax=[Clostridium] aminophilum TaxID=1526 RepID=UPI00332A8199